MKKILCVLMALVTLLGVGGSFVSCKQEPTSEEVVRFPIISNGSSNYVIVYPEKASVSEIEAARLLREKIYELTGVRLKSLSEEFIHEITDEDIVYVGNTTFAPAQATKEQISREYSDAYAIDIVERNVYIVAASEAALINAVTCLIETQIETNYDRETNTLYFEGCLFEGKTVIPSGFSVANIREYSIIYPNSKSLSFQALATRVQSVIEENTGFAPGIYKDTEREEGRFEILIGETNRSLSARCYADTSRIMEYEMIVEQFQIQLAFGGYYSGEKCVEALSFYVLRNKDMLLSSGSHYKKQLAESSQELTSGADVRIMSANVMAYRWGESQYSNVLPVVQRCEIFAGILLKFQPDAVGIQETDEPWLSALPWYLDRMAKKDGVEYTHLFGKVTHEGNTMVNFSSIVYRSDLYQLDDSGCEVFSIWEATPNYFQRVASYVKLTSKTNPNRSFILVNTHWAHENDAYVNTCAVEQANLVKRLKAKYSDVSLFCTGDYNNLSTREWKDKYLVQLVTDIGGKIASIVAKDKNVLITPGGCRGSAASMGENVLRDVDDSFIDHIICTGAYDILRHDTIRENRCHILSDHSPIYADIDLR